MSDKARIGTHIQNMKYLLLFYGNNGYANTPQSYIIHKLPVLLFFVKSY